MSYCSFFFAVVVVYLRTSLCVRFFFILYSLLVLFHHLVSTSTCICTRICIFVSRYHAIPRGTYRTAQYYATRAAACPEQNKNIICEPYAQYINEYEIDNCNVCICMFSKLFMCIPCCRIIKYLFSIYSGRQFSFFLICYLRRSKTK